MERTENLNFNQTDRVAAIGKALSSEITDFRGTRRTGTQCQ